jgi:hypothetical protein
MVSLEHLAALDLLLWLRSTDRAAAVAGTNQSTISRRSRSALESFGVTIRRGADAWIDSGDPLLQLERQIHQRVRLMGRQPLRLEAPYWSRRRVLSSLPEGWCGNPAGADWVCDNPLDLLRARIVDACVLTPTQIPAQADDLVVIDLHRSAIELTLFPRHRLSELSGGWRRHLELGALHLRLLPFLPRSCRRRTSEWFAQLAGPAGPAAAGRRSGARQDAADLSVAFLTPEMRAAQELPWEVDASIAPFPYVERLVLLADLAAEPALFRLQEHLLQSFVPLAA